MTGFQVASVHWILLLSAMVLRLRNGTDVRTILRSVSHLGPTVAVNANPHPWRELRLLKRLALHWQELRPGMWGATDGDRIWMVPRQLQVERRCTLAHELEHIHRARECCRWETSWRHVPTPVIDGRLRPDEWDAGPPIVGSPWASRRRTFRIEVPCNISCNISR